MMTSIAEKFVLVLAVAATSLPQIQAQPLRPTAPAAGAAVRPTSSGVAATNLSGPKIQFAATVGDFGRQKSGLPAHYTYAFTNAGEGVLEIKSVQPACGCTTAGEWTKQVEAGKTGVIPIKFNTANLHGPVSKTITIYCNDPTAPAVLLQIKGVVWKAIDVNPQVAVLNVTADSQRASAVLRVVNNLEEPLTLSPPESNSRAFAAEITTNQPGREFQIVVSTVPPLSLGPVQGQITVKTSSTNAPVITVTAFANVPPAVIVVPSQLALPPAPLAGPTTLSVLIQNHSTNALQISEPAINGKHASVQLKELKPGRSFSALLSFPQGFEIAQGEHVEFTFKSNHPLCPLVKVPVTQAAPPNGSLAPASGANAIPPGPIDRRP